MDQPWIDVTLEQPAQYARALMKFSDGKVRIGDYDKFDYRLWSVTQWKYIPSDERQ